MRWYLALLVSAFAAAVNALSSSGSRLLVVLDDTTDKSAYSILWSDLEGNQYQCKAYELLLTLIHRPRIRPVFRIAQE